MTDAENFAQAKARIESAGRWHHSAYKQWCDRNALLYDGEIKPGIDNPDLQQYEIAINEILANVSIQAADNTFNDPEFVVECLSHENDDGENATEAYLTATWRYSELNQVMEQAYIKHAVFAIAPVLLYAGEDGWPKARALDPRMCAWDNDIEDYSQPLEWFATRYYLAIWEVRDLYAKAKNMTLKPDIVELRGDTREASIDSSGQTVKSNRIQVWEYWQREDNYHLIWLPQKPDEPLEEGDITEVDGQPHPGFPPSLVVPIRILTGVPAMSRTTPHSWVELGEEAQRTLNMIDTALLTSGRRAAPGYVYDKDAFDVGAQQQLNEGNIQGAVPATLSGGKSLRDTIAPLPTAGFSQDLVLARQAISDGLKIIMNVTSYKQGQGGGSRETATAASFRVGQGGIRSAGEEKKFRRFIAKFAGMIRDWWLWHGSGDLGEFERDPIAIKVRDKTGQKYYLQMTHNDMSRSNLYFPAYIEVKEGSMLLRDMAADQQMKAQALMISAQLVPLFQQVYGMVPNLMVLLQEFYRSLGYRNLDELLGKATNEDGSNMDPAMLQALMGSMAPAQGAGMNMPMLPETSGMIGATGQPSGAEPVMSAGGYS